MSGTYQRAASQRALQYYAISFPFWEPLQNFILFYFKKKNQVREEILKERKKKSHHNQSIEVAKKGLTKGKGPLNACKD